MVLQPVWYDEKLRGLIISGREHGLVNFTSDDCYFPDDNDQTKPQSSWLCCY